MDIVRNADGTLIVPVQHERQDVTEDNADISSTNGAETEVTRTDPQLKTRVLHPGEGGYDEALAEWDLQQNPDREPVVSTATGREQAMALVHALTRLHRIPTRGDRPSGSTAQARYGPRRGLFGALWGSR